MVIPSASGGRTSGRTLTNVTPESPWPVVQDPDFNHIDMDQTVVTNEMLPAIARQGYQMQQKLGFPVDLSLKRAIEAQPSKPAGMNFVPDQPQMQNTNPSQPMQAPVPQQVITPSFIPKAKFTMDLGNVKLPAICHDLQLFLPDAEEPGRPPMLIMVWDRRAEDQGYPPPPKIPASGDEQSQLVVLVQENRLACTFMGMTFEHGSMHYTIFIVDMETPVLVPSHKFRPHPWAISVTM